MDLYFLIVIRWLVLFSQINKLFAASLKNFTIFGMNDVWKVVVMELNPIAICMNDEFPVIVTTPFISI